MPLQNFVARNLPTISAVWLNAVDVLKFTIFADSTTKAQARTALTSDAPLEIVNGGTAARTAAAARDSLGTGVNFNYFGTDSGAAGAAVVTPLSPFLSTPVLVVGMQVAFSPVASNPGTATLNFAGTGVKNIVNQLGNACTGGELSLPLVVEWNGVSWRIIAGSVPPSLARQPAETLAGEIPTNYLFPMLNILRYGAVGDGVTNDAPAFQSAINVAKKGGGTVIVPAPPATATPPANGPSFLLTSPLNCTNSTTNNIPGWGIRGDYGPTTGNVPEITIKHTGHGFDLSGNYGVLIENLNIRTDAVTQPLTVFFLARNNTGANSQFMRFQNVTVVGYCTNSIVYNYGSEDDVYTACSFWNYATGAGTRVITWTANNISGLSSTFITIAVGSQSCIDHQVLGGQFANKAGTASTDVFYLESVQSVKIFGPWVSCGIQAGAGGRSIVFVDLTNASTDFCDIYGLQIEHTGGGANQQQYGVLFSNTARTPTSWRIDSGVWDNRTFFLAAAGGNPTIDSFYITNISEVTTHGLSIPGTLQNSRIDGVGALTIGTSSKNWLIGPKANMTITTRTNDAILDNFTGALLLSGGFALYGNAALAAQNGWGIPTGNAVVTNFPGATATLLQTSTALAEIINVLKQAGILRV